MILFLVSNLFSVYFASQVLQMSVLINPNAHDKVTPFSLIYDLLYSLLIVMGLHQLHGTVDKKMSVRSKITYTCACHIGALAFALCGEVPFLSGFTLTSGCWSRLPTAGKLVISTLFALLLAMVVIKVRRICQRKTWYKQIIPMLSMVTVWGTLWFLLYDESTHYQVHVHHALFAGFLACCFDDFTTVMDVAVNGVLVGIVIEGIDFYGIGELTLFIIKDSAPVQYTGILVTWSVVFLALIGFTLKTPPRAKTHPRANIGPTWSDTRILGGDMRPC